MSATGSISPRWRNVQTLLCQIKLRFPHEQIMFERHILLWNDVYKHINLGFQIVEGSLSINRIDGNL